MFRHKNELTERYETFFTEYPANFSHFMNDISKEFREIWNIHMRDQILLFIEKRLRWFRIIALRIEHLLFRATHHVRDASNRNGVSADKIVDANLEQDKDIK
ncbi:MAG: hypothetical protein AAB795_01890 [Patescibacteria group bacterium]